MTTKLLLYAALLTASSGLALAATHILRTNRSIATVWPDWEGIKSTIPLWTALTLALCLSIATAFIPEKPAETSKIPQPVPKAENLKLEKEIAQLRNQIKELKQKESTQTQPSPTSATNPTKNNPEPPRQTAAQTTPNPQQQPPQPNPTPPTTQKTAPPSIEQLRQTVIQALITGSTKSLETVAHKSLLNILANQLTINPFHYSNLQSALKHRLRNGYTP